MNKETIRKALLIFNYLTIFVLAVMAIVQIWFNVWDDWEMFVKLLSTYLVVLIASFFLTKTDEIVNMIFSATDKKKGKTKTAGKTKADNFLEK